jgi:5-methylcytosine-specific restriction endonuclease McrA
LLLAARFPKPDVRDSIRRLPQRSEAVAPEIGSESRVRAVAVVGELAPALVPEARQQRANTAQAPQEQGQERMRMAPSASATRMRIEPLSVDRFGVHFTVDREFRELLEEVRALASHTQPAGELLPLMKQALEVYRRELQTKRFGVGREGRRKRDVCASGARASSSRHIAAAVAREVYLRDGGCCTFCAQDGRRCAARRFLELDHIVPWAEGGTSTTENLRLRCRAHNLHAARLHFGAERISQAITSARCATRPL